MTDLSKIEQWDRNHEPVIICWESTISEPTAYCELCSIGVVALRESIETGFHIICRECSSKVVNKSKFAGRYSTSEEARKVFNN